MTKVTPLGAVDLVYRSDLKMPALNLRALAEKTAPERLWMVENLLPVRKATLLTGDGGVGKSLSAQLQCTCVALGLPFLGVPTRRARSAYMTWEDDGDELWRRQEAINRALGIRMSDLPGHLELLSFTEEASPFVIQRAETGIMPTELGQCIVDWLDQRAMTFACFDNASQIANIDHNAIEEVAPFAHWLNALAHKLNGSVLLLHHPNKSGADWLGSVAYTNQFRSRLLLTAPSDDDPNLRELTNPKANYAARGTRISFRWHDGAFLLESELPQDAREEIEKNVAASSANAIFLACLAARDGEVGPSPGPNYAPSIFEDMPEAKGLKRDALTAAMNRLRTNGTIEVAEVPRAGHRGTKKIVRLASPNTPRTHPEHPRTLPPNTTPEHTPNAARTRPELPPNTLPSLREGDSAALKAAAPSPFDPFAIDPDDVEPM